jgi:hypothetical protein
MHLFIATFWVVFFQVSKTKKVNECKEFFLSHIYFQQPTVVVTKIFNVGIYFFINLIKLESKKLILRNEIHVLFRVQE